MSKEKPSFADFKGARGSNAGDQFHELWALQRVLELLTPGGSLKALTVEGVATENPEKEQNVWDGVDCALYFNGRTIETAGRIEIAQLKYSSSDPDSSWTIARLTKSTKTTGNNSVIRRLATAYKGAKSRAKIGTDILIKLVSNQPTNDEVADAIASVLTPSKGSPAAPTAISNAKELKTAAGLNASDFKAFLNALDLSECGISSRSSLRDSITQSVASVLGDDATSSVLELLTQIRSLMMPEAARDIISARTVLGWFGIADISGLFPAPSEFKPVNNPIQRAPTSALITRLNAGTRITCLHGGAGCGKTTTLNQLEAGLPPSSVFVLFDCYGAGRYDYSTDRRHLPDHAFAQIANEISIKLGVPFLISRSARNPITVRRFFDRISMAGKILLDSDPNALLVIGIDAADNSITAARKTTPAEPCFVTELASADFSLLPSNVRFVFSSRTGRKESLGLPPETAYETCQPFDLVETTQFVRGTLAASDEWISQFQALSHGIPRVQAYAMTVGNGDIGNTLNALRPNGKDLPDVLRQLFTVAAKKSGDTQFYAKLLSSLAALSPPIPIAHLAAICAVPEAEITDFVQDTWPGLRIEADGIAIADEDVEDFIRAEGAEGLQSTYDRICDHFSKIHEQDVYAAINYADMLAHAGRAAKILPIIEKHPTPAAIPDPIVRREIQLRRLRLALSACEQAGSVIDSTKVVLLSAEASKDEAFLASLLNEHPDLASKFARTSLVRLVLADADNGKHQGKVLAHDAAHWARSGNVIQAREQLHSFEEWIRRRSRLLENESRGWDIGVEEITARTEAIALIGGAELAFRDLMRWTSPQTRLSVAIKLVPRLLQRQHKNIVMDALGKHLPPPVWDIILLVPLALAGERIPTNRLQKSLNALRGRLMPKLEEISYPTTHELWRVDWLKLVITACEIGYSTSVPNDVIEGAIKTFCDFEKPLGMRSRILTSHVLDIVIRAWLLHQQIKDKPTSVQEFIKYLDPTPEPQPSDAKKKRQSRAPTQREQAALDEEQKRFITTIFPVYLSCANIIKDASYGVEITKEVLASISGFGSDDYNLDRHHEGSSFRRSSAQRVLSLMHLAGDNWLELYAEASRIASKHDYPFAGHLLPLWEILLLRSDAHDFVLREVAKRSAKLNDVREPASRKVEAAIDFSRIILNCSESDAQALFEQAIALAQDVDLETFDQIRVLAALTEHAKFWEAPARRSTAPALLNFITDVSERLQDQDGFPWDESVDALVRLDAPTAIAAVSFWADLGLRRADRNLSTLLEGMLRLGLLRSPTCGPLLALLPMPSNTLIKEVILGLQGSDANRACGVIELLAENCLLHELPETIRDAAQCIADATNTVGFRPSGEAFLRLQQTLEFLSRRKNTGNKTSGIQSNELDLAPESSPFDFSGVRYVSTASIETALAKARPEGSFISTDVLVEGILKTVTAPADRIPFLNALSEANLGQFGESTRATGLLNALNKWDGLPAIEAWRRSELPAVITRDFARLGMWMRHGSTNLEDLLDATRASPQEKLQILMEGVSKSRLTLGSHTLFSVAELIVRTMSSSEAQQLFQWYLGRVSARIPDGGVKIDNEQIPSDVPEALGRFLFGLMSDIDTRLRWRAAHTCRQLARNGERETLFSVFSQYDRQSDTAFKDPSAPFYWQAGRLWTMMSAARIAIEVPTALVDVASKLADIALDTNFPHYLVREHAKAAVLSLATHDPHLYDAETITRVKAVNVSPFPAGQKVERSSGLRWKDGEGRRYDYGSDTLEYWFGPILRLFVGVNKETLLDALEHRLIDEWYAPAKVNWWDHEPRKARLSERQWGLYSSSKGSLPIIERHGLFLEWHAMLCVVGECIARFPQPASDDDEWETLKYRLSDGTLSVPTIWLADLRDPKPLEEALWFESEQAENTWVSRIPKKAFENALLSEGNGERHMVVIDGEYTVGFPKRETRVTISSALVGPETASALLRSLLKEEQTWAYHFPDANDEDRNFDKDPFVLKGWLNSDRNENGIDKKDVARNGIPSDRRSIAPPFSDQLALEESALPKKQWTISNSDGVAVEHLLWSDRPERFDGDSSWRERNAKSDGSLLQIRHDVLSSLLDITGLDLIVGIHIERRLEKEYGRTGDYEPKSAKKAQQFFILRQGGTIENLGGAFGTWRGHRRKAKNQG